MTDTATIAPASPPQHHPEWGRLTPLRDATLRWLARPARPTREVRRSCTILKVDRLGDFVVALGAIHCVVDHFGPAHTRLIVSPHAAELAAEEFPAVERVILPAFAPRLRNLVPAYFRWRPTLGGMSADTLVCLRHQVSAYRDLLLHWLPAGRRFVLNGPVGERPILTIPHNGVHNSYPASPQGEMCRELIAHRTVIGAALGQAIPATSVIPKLACRSRALTAGRSVVIAPMAGAAIRDVQPAIIRGLVEVLGPLGCEFVLVGSRDQAPQLERLRGDALAAAPGRVVAGRPIAELIEVIGNAALVVSAESGPAHLAAALDRPLIALLGGGHYGLLAPWRRSQQQLWLHQEMPCFGCDWACIHPEPRCLTTLPLRRIVATAQKLLAIER